MFGCGSINLARLANHLDQIHDMDTGGGTQRKWLKWSKTGICVPRQTNVEEPKEFNMRESGKFIYATRRVGLGKKL